jgi:spermidine/putrescine transport system substrate-binding protein
LASACGDGRERLFVYNFTDYIDPLAVADFETEFGVRVVYREFKTNEAMYADLTGGASYDVIFPSDYMIQRLIREGRLEPIDYSAIPNISNIAEEFRVAPHDPGGTYSVPYMAGTLGILYNSRAVGGEIDSWGELWNPKYKGRILMYDSQRDALTVALRYLGYSANSADADELNAAAELLIAQKPLVGARLTDEIKDRMIREEAALAVTYSGDAFYAETRNPDLKYVVPKEGSGVFYDGMVIAKGTPRKRLAELFINYMCRPGVALRNTLYTGYIPVNSAARSLLPETYAGSPTVLPGDELERCEWFLDAEGARGIYDEVWRRILLARE